MTNDEMTKEEINEWTGGAWNCICGETGIDGSFICPSCELSSISSDMERRKREREAWTTITEEVNDAIRNERAQELIDTRDRINKAINELQNRNIR